LTVLSSLLSEEKNEAKQTQNYETLLAKIQSVKDIQEAFKYIVRVFNFITTGPLKTKLFIVILQQMQQHEELSNNINLSSIAEHIESVFVEWGITSKKDKQTILSELVKLSEKNLKL